MSIMGNRSVQERKALLTASLTKPVSNLPVGSIQAFIDAFLKITDANVDYVHGTDVVTRLGQVKGNVGILHSIYNTWEKKYS